MEQVGEASLGILALCSLPLYIDIMPLLKLRRVLRHIVGTACREVLYLHSF